MSNYQSIIAMSQYDMFPQYDNLYILLKYNCIQYTKYKYNGHLKKIDIDRVIHKI